jgi:hypothetical protein
MTLARAGSGDTTMLAEIVLVGFQEKLNLLHCVNTSKRIIFSRGWNEYAPDTLMTREPHEQTMYINIRSQAIHIHTC